MNWPRQPPADNSKLDVRKPHLSKTAIGLRAEFSLGSCLKLLRTERIERSTDSSPWMVCRWCNLILRAPFLNEKSSLRRLTCPVSRLDWKLGRVEMEMGHVRNVTLFIRPSLSALQFGMGSVKLGSVASVALADHCERPFMEELKGVKLRPTETKLRCRWWGRMFWWQLVQPWKMAPFGWDFLREDGKWHTPTCTMRCPFQALVRWFNLDMGHQLLQIAGCFLENSLENHPHIQWKMGYPSPFLVRSPLNLRSLAGDISDNPILILTPRNLFLAVSQRILAWLGPWKGMLYTPVRMVHPPEATWWSSTEGEAVSRWHWARGEKRADKPDMNANVNGYYSNGFLFDIRPIHIDWMIQPTEMGLRNQRVDGI